MSPFALFIRVQMLLPATHNSASVPHDPRQSCSPPAHQFPAHLPSPLTPPAPFLEFPQSTEATPLLLQTSLPAASTRALNPPAKLLVSCHPAECAVAAGVRSTRGILPLPAFRRRSRRRRRSPPADCSRCSGEKLRLYVSIAARVWTGLKKCAKEYGSPKSTAAAELHILEPSIHTSGVPGISGETRIPAKGCPTGKRCPRNASSSLTCSGKSSRMGVLRSRFSASASTGPPPGARPIPRSTRPGYSA